MRASLCFLFALLTCSCRTCDVSIPHLGPGRTVISDIDDTIKDTHVKLGASHIPNPAIVFDGLRTWHPVPGMASLYGKKWGPFSEQAPVSGRRRESTIIYVSAGPCRYEKRLRCVIPKWRFPTGMIVLRGGGLIPPPDYKTRAIAPIIAASPQRHFILVGDSGEHDPECYGELARRFHDRIDSIYIRDISVDGCARYKQAFRDVPASKIHFLRGNLADKEQPRKMLDCYSY